MASIFDRIGRVIKRKPAEHLSNPAERGLIEMVERDVPTASQINERHWRNAIESWLSRTNPDRVEMYQLINMIWLFNPRIKGMWMTREEHLMEQPFDVVDRNGNTVQRWVDRLSVPGFEQFRRIVFETPWYGHSLIEIRANASGNRWWPFLFPRTNVLPEQHLLVLDGVTRQNTIDYTEERFGNLIELGDRFEPGHLVPIALRWIGIKFLQTRRNQYLDRYAFPTVHLGAVNNTPEQQQKLSNALKKFAQMKSIITGVDDKFNLHETSSSQSDQFSSAISELESEVRELILGSSPTNRDGNNAAANSQRALTESKLISDKRRVEAAVNNHLLPVLGASKSLKFKYLTTTMENAQEVTEISN